MNENKQFIINDQKEHNPIYDYILQKEDNSKTYLDACRGQKQRNELMKQK